VIKGSEFLRALEEKDQGPIKYVKAAALIDG